MGYFNYLISNFLLVIMTRILYLCLKGYKLVKNIPNDGIPEYSSEKVDFYHWIITHLFTVTHMLIHYSTLTGN